MITASNEKWQEISQRVTRMVDALGQPIDAGIRDTVIVLNFLGINTLASCEGHLDHGTGAPWVDIGSSDARPLAKIAMRKLQEVDMARQQGIPPEERQALMQEAEQAKLAVKHLHLTERQKMMQYLDQFYARRLVSYDRRLIINPAEWTGVSRLESQGSDLQCIADPDEKARKLAEYQDEMRAFTEFLKERYFA